ncbi:MAG: cobyric acid synthase [Pseudomonadota bacterium]
MAKALMIQGAGSNVGKSILVAGICRLLARQGLTVAPFKPQNMSNNAAVTEDGGEIGRAQALQARAAGRPPRVDMNPVLLKPESEIGAQVIVQGQRLTTAKARDYFKLKPTLLPRVLDSFRRMAAEADWVIVEGAGSPAEVNLRPGDIANMGFAEAAGVPVALIGDIDRGGVIAQLVGTQAVLPDADAARIKAFAVNKFRGDTTLFHDGMQMIADATGWAPLGIIPWFSEAWRLPAEDIMDLAGSPSAPGAGVRVVVPRLPRIANFDDLDPLAAEPGVSIDIVEAGRALPGDADLVILPGSKSTIADLAALRSEGWDIDLAAHVRRGGHVLGICGGYQMLGRRIDDPGGIEGASGAVPGLGLLDVETVMEPMKRLALSEAQTTDGLPVSGYEIHIGRTHGPDTRHAWLTLDGRPEGAASLDGRVRGCYIHGLFGSDAFRADVLSRLGGKAQVSSYEGDIDETLDALADHLEASLDIEALLALGAEV